jgi:hypothetical protein
MNSSVVLSGSTLSLSWPRSRAVALRAILLVGCALTVVAAARISNTEGYILADPDLARLLRGMAVIKSVAVLAAVSAVLWRFGWRVTTPVSITYIVGSWTLAGTTMLIWQLTWIVSAAVAFHAALLGILLAAWRDDQKNNLRRSPRSA